MTAAPAFYDKSQIYFVKTMQQIGNVSGVLVCQ
jgi:hypothetical protein